MAFGRESGPEGSWEGGVRTREKECGSKKVRRGWIVLI